MTLLRIIRDFFLPSGSNRRMPFSVRGYALLCYASVAVVVAILVSFSQVSSVLPLPFRAFFAALSQEFITSQVNSERERISILPLSTNSLLSEAARLKAEDMIARDYFSHRDLSGNLPWMWFNRVGYRYAAAGENLAIDFSDSNALVRAWLNSPTHAKIIQNGTFRNIGIGIASGDFQGRYTSVAVMFVGTKTAASVASVATPLPPTPPPLLTQPPATSLPTPPPTAPPVTPPPVMEPGGAITDEIPAGVPLIVQTQNEPEPLSPDSGISQIQALKSSAFTTAPLVLRWALSTVLLLALFSAVVVLFGGGRAALILPRASACVLLLAVLWAPVLF